MEPREPPSQQDPFPDVNDSALSQAEKEIIYGPHAYLRPNPSELSDDSGPPSPSTLARNGALHSMLRCCQADLSKAYRRLRLSGTGTKRTLTERLYAKQIVDEDTVRSLVSAFNEQGKNTSIDPTSGEKAPNWTKNEFARLCHVMADPRHATVMEKLYNVPETRQELDTARHDPWSAKFSELFNDKSFKPSLPVGVDGVTDDIISTFDPCVAPHVRTGATLKSKWTKLRSNYTTSYQNYSVSGQNIIDCFPNFTDGDDTLSYMHCVFNNFLSLDMVVRLMPENARVEAGIQEVNDASKK